MKLNRRKLRALILEEVGGNQNYHSVAEFFRSNYGISYEEFFEARDNKDFGQIAEDIYDNGVFTPLVRNFPTHAVSRLAVIDELYRAGSLPEGLYRSVSVALIETSLLVISDGGPGAFSQLTFSRGAY